MFGLIFIGLGLVHHSLGLRLVGVIVGMASVVPVGQATRVYARRVFKIRRDSAVELKRTGDGFARWAGRHRRSLELASTPPLIEPLREALLASLIDPLRDGAPPKVVEMAVPRSRADEQLKVHLGRRNLSAAEREFLKYAQTWWRTTNEELAKHRMECERALAAAMAQLQDVTAPRGLRSRHASLQSDLRDEYIALSTLYGAIAKIDPEAALAADEDLASARARVRATTTAILRATSGRPRIFCRSTV